MKNKQNNSLIAQNKLASDSVAMFALKNHENITKCAINYTSDLSAPRFEMNHNAKTRCERAAFRLGQNFSAMPVSGKGQVVYVRRPREEFSCHAHASH